MPSRWRCVHMHRSVLPSPIPAMKRKRLAFWFFLTAWPQVPLEFSRRAELLEICRKIRDALAAQGVTGRDGVLIDHVELFAAPHRPDADSRNFVLCPGAAYDRSPCGTGTSAKLAVLHAKGMLSPGEHWRQESIVGSRFVGWLEVDDNVLTPYIQGQAFVTGRTTLLYDPADPFRQGLG